MEHEIESTNTKVQKELVDKLSRHLQYLENQKVLLSKFVMNEDNVGNPMIERATSTLMLLKNYLNKKKEELSSADAVWLGYQLDDLEAEMNAG